jgi:hypothetical protein
VLYELRNESNIIVLKIAAAHSLSLPVHPRSGHVAFYPERLIVRMTRTAARDDSTFLRRSMGVDRSCTHSAVCSVTACLSRGEVTYEVVFWSSIFVSLLTRALDTIAVLLLI